MPRVSVIIVNWNGRAWLEDCLASLPTQTRPPDEIILVDNGSSDDSWQQAVTRFPAVQVIRNTTNLGFAAANNQGLRAASGEYLALLNNDARAEPDWLAELAAALESDPQAGMAASKMLFADRPQVINSAGAMVDRCGVSWDWLGGQADQPEARGARPVFGASGGAVLYRRAMLDEVGLFEATFFAYLEDVDLAWRARWRGWRAVYAPGARVLHHASATAGEGSPLKTYYLARNKLWLLARNYPWSAAPAYWPAILLYEGLSQAYAVTRGRGGAAARGRLDGLRGLGRAWRQRRALLAGARISPAEMLRALHPARWPGQVAGQTRHLRYT